ncbi:diaminopimelate decarboxylase [endosymbiont 'TC1' of Trimyema compressum]|uniref:diaminopimelate decarboxylase n=1 Tax=endosymbiont 'TC1' of Trimyema compressum TaxID=243899 RepID=UPI0007F126DE|nr:diaminopimelate decarboxylase [endosymbiont 'TC1' of Trimyema compressum]AMP20558.1 diaminopimelate decarboxylase [endosymbiont 'TC1' of Trimyema compressum]
MKLIGTMKVNEQNHLEIGGCDVVDLQKTYGTPLVVVDETHVSSICKDYYKNFTEKTNGKAIVLYASKAFMTPSLCKIINKEKLGLDVVSGGELFMALKAGFPAEKIFFHGNNKSSEELNMALDSGVGRIVIDNDDELEKLNRVAGDKGVKANVLLRITPGIDAATHAFIRTGSVDSKFGFTLPNGDALKGVEKAYSLENIKFKGLHCHIGSQIFEMQSFKDAVGVMVNFIEEIKKTLNIVVEDLDMGGGFGIYYTEEDNPSTIALYSENILNTLESLIEEKGLLMPNVFVEPGRSIIGPAGSNLYTVGSVKNIPGVRKYVSIDGGMVDNIRPALYDAKYEVALGNRMDEIGTDVVTVTGKCCESGDILARDIALPVAKAGDVLVMSSTGAYGYSMASNYNVLGKPAVVFVKDGESQLVIKRESHEDMMKNHILLDR